MPSRATAIHATIDRVDGTVKTQGSGWPSVVRVRTHHEHMAARYRVPVSGMRDVVPCHDLRGGTGPHSRRSVHRERWMTGHLEAVKHDMCTDINVYSVSYRYKLNYILDILKAVVRYRGPGSPRISGNRALRPTQRVDCPETCSARVYPHRRPAVCCKGRRVGQIVSGLGELKIIPVDTLPDQR